MPPWGALLIQKRQNRLCPPLAQLLHLGCRKNNLARTCLQAGHPQFLPEGTSDRRRGEVLAIRDMPGPPLGSVGGSRTSSCTGDPGHVDAHEEHPHSRWSLGMAGELDASSLPSLCSLEGQPKEHGLHYRRCPTCLDLRVHPLMTSPIWSCCRASSGGQLPVLSC